MMIKQHFNVGIVGTEEGLSTALASAIYTQAMSSPFEDAILNTGWSGLCELETEKSHYALEFFPPMPAPFGRFYESLQAHSGMILVGELAKSIPRQTLSQCLWAQAAEVPRLLVYGFIDHLQSRTLPAEWIMTLWHCEYRNNALRQVLDFGSADQKPVFSIASVHSLIDTMDDFFHPISTGYSAPFVFPIGDVYQIRGRGTIVAGRVQSGQIRPGDTLQMVGFGQNRSVRCTNIEMYRRELDSANAGDNVGITLQGITKKDVTRGMLLVEPDSVHRSKYFDASVVSPPNLGTRFEDVLAGAGEFNLFMHTMVIPVTITVASSGTLKEERYQVRVHCPSVTPIKHGWRFVLMFQHETVGYGIVSILN